MALRWDFREKSGTVTMKNYGKPVTLNWYEGNAMMIVLNEWKEEDGEERYSLSWFFCDEAHAKNCLGMSKGHENMFDESNTITKLTVYREHCRGWDKVVKLFAKAFPNIEIEILAKAQEGVEEQAS